MQRLPLVSPLDRALFLKAQPYLEGVEPSVLAALASYTGEREYTGGAVIREGGGAIESICFLGTGAVELIRRIDDSVVSRTVEAPGAVGMAHFFARDRDTPTVRAIERTLCLEVATTDLLQILEDHFSLLLQMARTSSEQVILNFRALGPERGDEEGFAEADRRETPAQLDWVQRLGRSKRMPFFRGVNLTVLSELIRADEPKHVPEGHVLWKPGDHVDRMVLVLDGAFRSESPCGSTHAPAGAMLGGWELLLNEPRFEGWVATQPSRILSIERELFTDILEDHFDFAMGYLARLSARLIDGWDRMQRLERQAGGEPT